MDNKETIGEQLTGKKRNREETENIASYSNAKRIKPNHSEFKTPFTSIPNFEPHILNIISSYTKPELSKTHHHWWFIHGLSKNIVKAIESITLCKDLETFKLFAKLPEFRDDCDSHVLHTKAMLLAMQSYAKNITNYINDCKDIHSGYKDDNLMTVAKSMSLDMVILLAEKLNVAIPTSMYDTLFYREYWHRECNSCGYWDLYEDDYHFIFEHLGYPIGLCHSCYTAEIDSSSDDDSSDSDT